VSCVPIFNEKAHTYTDPEDHFQYLSVTRWVEQYKPYFDEMGWAKKIATREGVSVGFILEDWEKKREDSKLFGTAVHRILETYFKSGKIIDSPLKHIVEKFIQLNVTLDKKNCFFEKLVFNKELKIAGTSDVIMHNTGKKTFNVYDFKTNKKLRYASAFKETLNSPLSHYPCSEYFTYALQLSMYAYLYKLMSGLEPNRLKIFWYNRVEPENYKNLDGEWQIINVPYLEEDILKCNEKN